MSSGISPAHTLRQMIAMFKNRDCDYKMIGTEFRMPPLVVRHKLLMAGITKEQSFRHRNRRLIQIEQAKEARSILQQKIGLLK